MKIEVVEITEKEDGSATITLDLDEEGLQYLVSEGMNSLLRNSIDSRGSYSGNT